MREEPTRSLLLLDADADERRLISAIAARAGWSVVAGDEEQAVAVLQGPHGREVQAALLGSWNEDASSNLIAALRGQRSNLPIIVLSHGDTVSVAVDVMRAGASDFLVRPVAPERLLEALAANADRRRPAGELAPVSEKLAPPLALEQLIGASPEFRAALAVAAKSARNRLPVLIIGEPGTGKETVARAIHAASLRAKGPLLTIDCKAIPANIVDSELFGHEKGAFPGAFTAKTGKLVQADGGTLILDEITALPAETQELLDRVLATGEVRPVGLNGSHSVDVRVISTSSRPLPDDFHPGLAERIGATAVNLPPLRDRSSDIPSLARHLLNRLSEQPGAEQHAGELADVAGPAVSNQHPERVVADTAGPATSASSPACCSAPGCNATAARSPPTISRTSRFSRATPTGRPTLRRSSARPAATKRSPARRSSRSIPATAICARSRRSRRTSFASPSATIAGG
jgi:DNA-binding NtrC family response regulator